MKRAKIILDKDKVNKLVKGKFGTIENYLKYAGITRMWYWQILNRPHLTRDTKCLQDLSRNLEVSIDTILI